MKKESYLTFAPDVTEKHCFAEHWIHENSMQETVKMTPEEIETLNWSILQTPGTRMSDVRKESMIGNYGGCYEDLQIPKRHRICFSEGERNSQKKKGMSVDIGIQYGIAVSQGLIKQLPTETFQKNEEDPEDLEWDEAALCLCMVGEPLLVISSEQDEKYLYVQSECSEGWLLAEAVAICRDREEWLQAAFPAHPLVITGDMVWLEASVIDKDAAAYRLRMGTVLELCEEPSMESKRKTEIESKVMVLNRVPWHNYVVWLPCRASDGSFFRKKGLIPMSRDVSVGYLSLTTGQILRQAFKCLGDRYGWGGMLESRDCSSYIREVYRCFGLWLPRNTMEQVQMPVRKVKLAGMSCLEKGKILKELEPGILLFFPGHVMMYLGYENGEFYVINNVSTLVKEDMAVSVRVRSVIVNPLSVRRPNLRTWMEELTMALILWKEPA